MKTLIELYDNRPLENVLATDTFQPETTVFLCPSDITESKPQHKSINDYFRHRGLATHAVFVTTNLLDAKSVINSLRFITAQYPDCALDITGGNETALFACGLFCSEEDLPVFTYSRRNNCFFNIRHADFADRLPCRIHYSIQDLFLMAGARLQEGRDSNQDLVLHQDQFPGFYELYLAFRRNWPDHISYLQQISQPRHNEAATLHAQGHWQVHGSQGRHLQADPDLLQNLAKLGFIRNLDISPQQEVEFDFVDEASRFWLRDVGSFLEVYVWDVCRRSGLFTDLRCSTVVNWDGLPPKDAVTNEIDVMAVRGIKPLLLSCKACPVKTEAVNELAILRDRFGGQMASAAVITTYPCRAVTRRRAMELGMDIIDRSDLQEGRLLQRLKRLTELPY
ncbi:MAG: DUF1887 family CARF protein [Oscillospiraceae bacterium]|nr:DUF1887 family CARF protein [Oscillospiraceae bacterium]